MRKVVVIGAGTMGSGIAAHLSNIGFQVSLLDLTTESVAAGFDRAKKARPPHFYTPTSSDLIRLGSIEENLEWVAEADWVCEAIIEKLDAKRELFAKLDGILPLTTMVTTNTSGLQIELLAEGRSDSFRSRFMGTHFFNPPRYLKLLELIPTSFTDPAEIARMTQFLEDEVARRVVLAKDTPGFIANRFGMWSMFKAIHVAENLRLTAEQVDTITGPFLGRPRSASFRLNDIVGLDIMQDIAGNLISRCPDDPHLDTLKTPTSMDFLIAKGWIGDKSGNGYYRKEGKELMALDFGTMAYRQRQEPELATVAELSKTPIGERLALALERKDEVGEFLREYLVPTLRYADYLKEEISHNVRDFDRVMMWGFGWEIGPFGLIDAIGAERLGIESPAYYKGINVRDFSGSYISLPPEPQYRTIQEYPIIEVGEGFNIREMGDGVSAVSLSTKMGTINPDLVRNLTAMLREGKYGRIVLTSEAKIFSAGFDLTFFQEQIEAQDWAAIEQSLKELQDLASILTNRRAVAAVFGYCLGAGLELAMACPQIAAHPDSVMGLPEAKVGLIPGGGGTVRMRLRAQSGGAKSLADMAIQLTVAPSSANADDARRLGYLRTTDVTAYHPDRLLHDAKMLALSVEPRADEDWSLVGGPTAGMIDTAQDALKTKGEISDHDEFIGDRIKHVFTKANSLEDAFAKEREQFLELCRNGVTLQRIRHMLETGKPLRN